MALSDVGKEELRGNWHNKEGCNSHEIRSKMRDAEKIRASKESLRHATAKEEAFNLWNRFYVSERLVTHPYLNDKEVKAYGIASDGHRLLIPLRDIEGNLWSIQYIDINGYKQFLKGGRKKGMFSSYW